MPRPASALTVIFIILALAGGPFSLLAEPVTAERIAELPSN